LGLNHWGYYLVNTRAFQVILTFSLVTSELPIFSLRFCLPAPYQGATKLFIKALLSNEQPLGGNEMNMRRAVACCAAVLLSVANLGAAGSDLATQR
jgi:hypothetical protein